MPRYYFDLLSSAQELDEKGQELPGLIEARAIANDAATVLATRLGKGDISPNDYIRVRNEAQESVFVIRLRDAVA